MEDLKNLGMPEVFIARSLEENRFSFCMWQNLLFFILISYLNLGFVDHQFGAKVDDPGAITVK